jgi:peptidoglycan/xylan/chitin deacetylase (PgdA/CDA1 family)
VVLTYDDGPEPGGTDQVLRALAAHGATATFFVLLTRVRRYQALLAEVIAAGHEIGLHGADHQALTSFEPEVAERRTADAKTELEDVIGLPVRWFRPPYGRQSAATWRAVIRTGLTPVLWTIAVNDWLEVPADERLAAASAAADPGAIVLAHDGYATIGDGVDDGPAPQIDRGGLATGMLDLYRRMDLAGCSLGQALQTGTPVTSVRLTSQ